MRTRVALLAPALLVVAGCTSSPPADEPSAALEPSPSVTVPKSPPQIVLLTKDGEVAAAPGSSCWQSGESVRCADMVHVPVRELPDVGDPTTLEFRFGMPDARFTAYLDEIGGPGRTKVQAVDLGDGIFRLRSNAAPDRYRVTLVGDTSAGKAPGEFVWTLPAPSFRGVAGTPAPWWSDWAYDNGLAQRPADR